MSLIYLTHSDVGLRATVLDSDGNPVTGSVAVSLAVTDPLGAITSPAPSGDGTGAYTAVVPGVSVPGVWLFRWEAPGWADEGQFTVRDAGLEQIVDLPSVKAHLNMPANDTRADDELMGFIYAASEMARHHCGPYLPETHVQFFDGGVASISPDWLPIGKVLSATEYYGLSGYTLTEQDLGGQMNAFAFTVDYASGTITRRTFGGEAALFAAGTKNVKLVYTAGSRPVPYLVRLGALELVRHLWQCTQQGGRPKFGGAGYDGSDAMIPVGFALPNRVIELWQGDRRPPGIA